jgi:lipopolysaccharide transport system ATP-binding protein
MSHDSDIAVQISSVSKSYWVYQKPWHRLMKSAIDFLRYNLLNEGSTRFQRVSLKFGKEIKVLNNLNFKIAKGQIFGLVGRNGAGKSTLLHLICGTQLPTSGRIETHGKIAALLELGSGFNPNFTGRENVYFNAQILGLTRAEVDAKYNQIVEFADIGQYIDHEVSTYSSGMFVRLAFAVVAHVDAEVLVVDEALAVGDVFFQQKCLRYLRDFKAKGGTIIFVSHDTASVSSLCDAAALLFPNGQVPIVGLPDKIIKHYLSERNDEAAVQLESQIKDVSQIASDLSLGKNYAGVEQIESVYSVGKFREQAESFGNGSGKILRAWLFAESKSDSNIVASGQKVQLLLRAIALNRVAFPAFGFMFKDRHGQFLFAESSDLSFRGERLALEPGIEVEVIFDFVMPTLVLGEYSINLAFADGIGDQNVQLHWLHDAITFTCIQSRLIHGICGVPQFKVSIKPIPETASV